VAAIWLPRRSGRCGRWLLYMVILAVALGIAGGRLPPPRERDMRMEPGGGGLPVPVAVSGPPAAQGGEAGEEQEEPEVDRTRARLGTTVLPEISLEEIEAVSASEAPERMAVVIDTIRLRLTLYLDHRPVRVYTVAAGKQHTPTPKGFWYVAGKGVWGGAFGPRWNGLSIPWGSYGIHGTNRPGSIGSHASHGCVRMDNRQVIELSRVLRIGTPVKIIGYPCARFGEVKRTMKLGILGSDVYLLQSRLQSLGFYPYERCDGRFEWGTHKAVKAFQEAHGLEPTGEVDSLTAELMGLKTFADDPTIIVQG